MRRPGTTLAALLALAGGCGGGTSIGHGLSVEVTGIPSTSAELVSRIVVGNKASAPETWSRAGGKLSASESFGLTLDPSVVGYAILEVIARDANHCELAGNNYPLILSASTDPTRVDFPLATDIPTPECNFVRTPGMAYVRAGNYVIGCDLNAADPDCQPAATPATTLHFEAFEIDGTEITVGAYEDCVKAGACTAALPTAGPLSVGSARNNVDWDQADAFCRWMGKRLPTEGEWEASARGGDARLFPWGDAAPTCDLAYFQGCQVAAGPDQIEVARFDHGRSPTGSYDMAGNVAEWVSDWAAQRTALTDAQIAGGGPPTGAYKVVKGGGFTSNAAVLRVAFRGSLLPDGTDTSINATPAQVLPTVGFRCALSR